MSKRKELLPTILCVGIVAVSVLSSVLLFDRFRIHDLLINSCLIYFLFFADLHRDEDGGTPRSCCRAVRLWDYRGLFLSLDGTSASAAW